MRFPVFFSALLLLPTAAWAQGAAPPQTTLSVNARLVTLPVVVRDKKGKLVSGLTRDDFLLTEDGRPESIRYFSLDGTQPLTLALDVDTSGSLREALDTERSASQSFLDNMVTRPEDRAAVLHFDREVELLEDLTASKPRLREALNQLGPTPEKPDTGGEDGGERRHGGTQLYDAIYLSAHDLLQKQSGRKAIVVLSDGQDRGSKETLNEAVEAAQKAEAVVYTIYFKGESPPREFGRDRGNDPTQGGYGRRGGMGYPGGGMGYPGGGGGYPGGGGRGGQQPSASPPRVDGKKLMEEIAGRTGGRCFEAKKKENFDGIYREIAEELRGGYLLGYTPDAAGGGEGFHRISLSTTKKDLLVQTREGYYGGSGGATSAGTSK